MFLEYFQMREDPFGVTPDPTYLYLSRTHFDALDALRSGIVDGRGFLALIAEPGMGKTTLLYQLMDILPEGSRVAFLFQTQCTSREFFQYLLSELGVDTRGMGLVAMHGKLNEMMFDEMLEAKRFVLIIDEAQNLDTRVLETIRLLSNFESPHSKLLQIVLAGQPGLGTKLKQEEMSQLLQRVSLVKHLSPLSLQETVNYIRHRLKVAGYAGGDLFTSEALVLIQERSKGIPRLINKFCYNALTEAQFAGSRIVSADIVQKAQEHMHFTATVKARQTYSQPSIPARTKEQPPKPELLRSNPDEPSEQADDDLFLYPEERAGWRRWIPAVAAAVLLAVALALPTVRNFLAKGTREGLASVETLVTNLETRSSATNAAVSPSTAIPRQDELESGAAPEGGIANVGQSPSLPVPGMTSYTVVLDPGHGGADSGFRGPHGLLEKNVCLELALRLGQMIEERLPGATVIYTRNDDQQLSTAERIQIANQSKADLFLSIHADSAGNDKEPLVQMFYANSANARGLASSVRPDEELEQASFRALTEALATNRGVKVPEKSKALALSIENAMFEGLDLDKHAGAAGMSKPPAVLDGARVPAVAAEIGFGPDIDRKSLLIESNQRAQVAESMFQGIKKYMEEVKSPSRGTEAAGSGGVAISSSLAQGSSN